MSDPRIWFACGRWSGRPDCFFLTPILVISGSWCGCGLWLISFGCLSHSKMDPSWSDMKHILCRHEEIGEANSLALQQVMTKMGELDQLLRVQIQCIDNLELECQHFRSLVLPQHSQSTSYH
jgi:hypothetical protein